MRSACRLFLVSLIVLGGATCGPACCEAQIGEFFDSLRRAFSGEEAVVVSSDEAQLTEQQRSQAIVTDGPLAIFFSDSNFGTTNAYGTGGIRFFATRMVLTNLSEETVEIPSAEIELDADGQVLRLNEIPTQVANMAVWVGDTQRPLGQLKTPETIRIAAAETISVWLVFTELPGGLRAPSLTLRMPVAGKTISADVTGFHSRLLQLTEERLGPGGCLCLIRVNGELNSINATELVDAMIRQMEQQVSRFVLAWPEGAAPLSDELVQWLLTARMPRGFGWRVTQSLLPTLPGDLRELNIVRIPSRQGTPRYQHYYNGIPQVYAPFDDEEAAVVAALRTVVINLSPAVLLKEIEQGHPLSRSAMLAHGAHLLPESALPLVIELTQAESEAVRVLAIRSLGEFAAPRAIELLCSLSRTGTPGERLAALEGLAHARYPQAHRALEEILNEEWPVARRPLLEILARHPREAWMHHIMAALDDPDVDVRLSALQALGRLGHPDRLDRLAEALTATEPEIRQEAFRQLTTLSESRAREVVIGEAVRIIDTEGVSASVQEVLQTYSDPQLVAALLRRFRSGEQGRNETAAILIRMADDRVIQEVLDEFDLLHENEQANVLQWLAQIEHPRAGELAQRCLESRNTNLVRQAVNALRIDGSDEAVALMLDILRRTEDSSTWYAICQSVVYCGGAEVERVLLDARNSPDENKRRFAMNMLRSLRRRSPAGMVVDQAQQYLMTEDWEQAVEILQIAVEIDPNYSEAHTSLGNARLRLDQEEQAEQDFRRALRLDPLDGQAITGLGCILAGRGEIDAALTLVDEHYEMFTHDPIYIYNVACVCGRGVKALASLPDSEEMRALRGRLLDRSFRELEKSIESGAIDYDLVHDDPDLEALHDDSRFRKILEPLEGSSDGQVPARTQIFGF